MRRVKGDETQLSDWLNVLIVHAQSRKQQVKETTKHTYPHDSWSAARNTGGALLVIGLRLQSDASPVIVRRSVRVCVREREGVCAAMSGQNQPVKVSLSYFLRRTLSVAFRTRRIGRRGDRCVCQSLKPVASNSVVREDVDNRVRRMEAVL